MREAICQLHPAALFGLIGTLGILGLAVMYLLAEALVRVHAWWTR